MTLGTSKAQDFGSIVVSNTVSILRTKLLSKGSWRVLPTSPRD